MKLPIGGDDSDLTVSLVAPSGDLTELCRQTLCLNLPDLF